MRNRVSNAATFNHFVDFWAQARPKRPAVTIRKSRLTYAPYVGGRVWLAGAPRGSR